MLYEEPKKGHWHVYVPNAKEFELSGEWKEYAGSEKPTDRTKKEESPTKLSEFIEENPIGCSTKQEKTGDVRSELSRKIGDKLIAKFKEGDHSKRIGFLDGSVVGRMYDLKGTWKKKHDSDSGKTAKPYSKIVYDNIESVSHELSFVGWYNIQKNIQAEMADNIEIFSITRIEHDINKSLYPNYDIEKAEEEHDRIVKELIQLVSPEVVLALVKAELLSGLDSDKYVDNLGSIFEAYNIAFGPSQYDPYFSSGLAQLTLRTFKHINERYNSRIREAQSHGSFASIVAPKNNDKRGICDAIVLDIESAIFWSYLSMIYHVKGSFIILMKNDTFKDKWDKSRTEEKMEFIATFAPVANNMGATGVVPVRNRILREISEMSLGEVAGNIQNYKMKEIRKRTAEVAHETMQYLISLTN